MHWGGFCDDGGDAAAGGDCAAVSDAVGGGTTGGDGGEYYVAAEEWDSGAIGKTRGYIILDVRASWGAAVGAPTVRWEGICWRRSRLRYWWLARCFRW